MHDIHIFFSNNHQRRTVKKIRKMYGKNSCYNTQKNELLAAVFAVNLGDFLTVLSGSSLITLKVTKSHPWRTMPFDHKQYCEHYRWKCWTQLRRHECFPVNFPLLNFLLVLMFAISFSVTTLCPWPVRVDFVVFSWSFSTPLSQWTSTHMCHRIQPTFCY